MKRRRSLALLGSILLGCGLESATGGHSDDGDAAWRESGSDAGSADAGRQPEGASTTDASDVDSSYDATPADVAVFDASITDSGSDALFVVDATDSAAPDDRCVEGAPCDDGNACSQLDTCQDGVCTGAAWTLCSAGDECHAVGTCNPTTGACSTPSEPDGTPCTSADICKVGATCTAGICGSGVDRSACASPFCSLPDSGCAAWQDTDVDGLSEAWERNGYVDVDCNGVYDGPGIDIPLPDADPTVPDVYVRYDYMVRAGAGAHDHAPPAAALDQVTRVFAAHGVKLHFDPPLAGIPEHLVTTLDPAPTASCAGTDFVTMKSLRAAYFGNRAPAYHYLVFAHRATCPNAAECSACPTDPLTDSEPNANATGAADIGGDDAIVAFGAFFDDGQPVGIELWASTVMHELGHNFGLKHGGTDHMNFKPNYVSVMNYAYQLNGIPVASAPGSVALIPCVDEPDCGPPTITTGTCGVPDACHCTDDLAAAIGTDICYRVDYSSQSLLPLNELSPTPGTGGLDESVGVGGPALDDDVVLYYTPGPAQLLGPSNGSAIDWNNDGTIESHATADVDNDNGYTFLSTRDDWARTGDVFDNLNFRYQCAASYSSGGTAAHKATDEMTRDWAREHRRRMHHPQASQR